MTQLELDRVTKVFGNGVVAVQDLSLDVPAGELLVLVGPSGCGKTTTLRLIAGLDQPSGGLVRLGGMVANHLPPRKRNVALAFQRPALFPNKSVRDNLLFGLRLAHPWGLLHRVFQRVAFPAGYAANRQREEHWQQRAEQAAEAVGLSGALDSYPWQLSGGQQQRLALARVLLSQAEVLLLDEPFSHLDTRLRLELRNELHLLHKRFPTTMVYVTHDPAEALALGDRIAVLQGGELQQIDRPRLLQQCPANRFVADFLGPYPLNFLDGELVFDGGGLWFRAEGLELRVPDPVQSRLAAHCGRRIALGIRPQDVLLHCASNEGLPGLEALLIEPTDNGSLVTGRLGQRKVMSLVGPEATGRIHEGQRIMMDFRWQSVCVFDRDSGRTLAAGTAAG
jgi:multiple sugar transport system ATP-binding protein